MLGFTLNAIKTAFDALANETSVSVISPMSEWIIFGKTSSFLIFRIAVLIASLDPWTSDLMIIFNSLILLSLKAESCVTKTNEFFSDCKFSFLYVFISFA